MELLSHKVQGHTNGLKDNHVQAEGGLWPPSNFFKILNSKYIFKILENNPGKIIFAPFKKIIFAPFNFES